MDDTRESLIKAQKTARLVTISIEGGGVYEGFFVTSVIMPLPMRNRAGVLTSGLKVTLEQVKIIQQ